MSYRTYITLYMVGQVAALIIALTGGWLAVHGFGWQWALFSLTGNCAQVGLLLHLLYRRPGR